MSKQHKHAELIKAWADGAQIECHYKSLNKWYVVNDPAWSGDFEFRVKPKWTPKYTLVVSEFNYLRRYWTLNKFVEEFEQDWDNQYCEAFKNFDETYKVITCDTYPSLGVVRMSKQCAEKLCEMLNSGEIEL